MIKSRTEDFAVSRENAGEMRGTYDEYRAVPNRAHSIYYRNILYKYFKKIRKNSCNGEEYVILPKLQTTVNPVILPIFSRRIYASFDLEHLLRI